MLRIAVLSTKGGVGKTTLTASLGALLADMGVRVLLIDADVQPSLSKFFDLKKQAPKGLFQAITEKTITADNISETVIENLSIVQSNDHHKMLQSWLASRVDGNDCLSSALSSPYMNEGHFDVCLIDTQGAMGGLQNNAALAASKILLPVVTDTLSARELSTGTLELIQRLEPHHTMRNRIGQIYAVLYRQERTIDSRMVTEELKETFFKLEGRMSLLKTVVPSAVTYKNSASLRKPVHRLEHKGTEETSPKMLLQKLIWELIPSIEGTYAADDVVDAAPMTPITAGV
jgi:chromosome partitioning related protein ParA